MKRWEIAGWLLVLMGLYIFYACFKMLAIDDPPRFVQSIPLVTIGIVVFRGGLHLLKVAAAAEACRLMQVKAAEVKPIYPPEPIPGGKRRHVAGASTVEALNLPRMPEV